MEGGRSEGDELIEDYVQSLMTLDSNTRTMENEHAPVPGPLIDSTHLHTGITMHRDSKNSVSGDAVEKKLEPVLGMEFESDEAAKMFYNEYARRLGFPFRVGRSRRSKGVQEVVIMKRFVCSKEGIYRKRLSNEGSRKRERISMREGCKAMMEVIRDSNRWVVSKLETAHNHHLGTCSRVGYLRARGFIDNPEKASIVASDAMSMLRQNAFGDGGDAQGLLDYFRRKQIENPSFIYSIQVDKNGSLTNAFWADARDRSLYGYFGDAVTFDTTFKKNKYMMPFVTFTGANHHLQPVNFGCALLIDESEFSFIWLFETWLTAMGGKHPVSLVTDQNRAMSAAISKVFPKTCHRLCKWLILSRCKQKLAHFYSAHPTLRAELENCIIESETIEAFETGWVSILEKYDLCKNTWLQALFNIRHRWVPLYLKDTFFAEVSRTHKLETMNDFYKKYFNTRTSLKVFLTQFDLSMESLYEHEAQADSVTLCAKPNLKTASPIEKQAADIYTKTVFEKFQEEFVESLGYSACRIWDGNVSKFSVVRDDENLDVFLVTYNPFEKTASCSCKHFEFCGILCRHILVVVVMIDLHEIPEEYFLKRWTKNAKSCEFLNDPIADLQSCFLESVTARYNDLCRDAMRFVETGATSAEIYKAAKNSLQKVYAEIALAEKNASRGVHRDAININEEVTGDESTNEQALQDPERKVTNLLGQLLGSSWSPM